MLNTLSIDSSYKEKIMVMAFCTSLCNGTKIEFVLEASSTSCRLDLRLIIHHFTDS